MTLSELIDKLTTVEELFGSLDVSIDGNALEDYMWDLKVSWEGVPTLVLEK